jgi:tetratricopeptide (TPR) repeat protein
MPDARARRCAVRDRRLLIASLVLVAALCGIYGQTRHHGFVNYDDPEYLSGNPLVSRGLTGDGLLWAFGYHANNWHPLTWLSHMLDAQLFGAWAGGHHLVSAGLHAAAGVLLLAVLARMTGAFWPSAAVAFLFALHPLRVESVAWAAERKDVLSGVFWMLSLGAYLRYVRRPGTGRYLAALGLFALGLAAKPMLVSLPVVLLLVDWWPLGRLRAGWSGALREKAPFLLLALAAGVVTLHAQTADVAPLVTPALPLRLANALVSAVVYLRQLLWPSGLAVLYPYPRAGIPGWEAAGALGLLAALGAAAVAARRRAPFLLVGCLWYLASLLPVSGIVQVGAQARADRYTYLPLVGVTLALAWGVGGAWPRTVPARRSLAVLAGCVCVCLASAANLQASRWRDSVALLGHSVRVTAENHIIMSNLGLALVDARRYDEAVGVLREAVRVAPDYCDAVYNLGLALAARASGRDRRKGEELAVRPGGGPRDPERYREALGAFERALACYEGSQGRWDYLVDTYAYLGSIELRLGRYPDAERHLRELLARRPDYPGAWVQLSIALVKQGRKAEAEEVRMRFGRGGDDAAPR